MSEYVFVDRNTMMIALEEEEVCLFDLQTLSLLWWLLPNDGDSIEVCVLWMDCLGWYDVDIEMYYRMNCAISLWM